MKISVVVAFCALAFSGSTVRAQDAVKAGPAHYKVLLDNATVRILETTYAPGVTSAAHHHPDSIMVALTDAKVEFTPRGGTSHVETLPKETARYSAAGVHTARNVGTTPLRAILVEFKAAAPGTASLPVSRGGMQMKTIAEGAYGSAYISTAGPDFAEAAGTTHAFDQVVISLGPASVSIALDGKIVKTTWQRGDTQFIGRGVAHETKNTGGKPVDMLLVAVK